MRGGYHIRISLTKPVLSPSSSSSYKQSHLDTSTFVPTSLFQPLPTHPPKSSARRYTIHHPRVQAAGSPDESNEHRDYRFGPVRLDWVDFDTMDLEGSKKLSGGKEKEKAKRGMYVFSCRACLLGVCDDGLRGLLFYLHRRPIPFMCLIMYSTGGPATASFVTTRTKSGTTNLPEGIVHIYREGSKPSADERSLTYSAVAASSASSAPLAPPPPIRAHSDSDGVLMGVLAVPAWMTPSDFLAFVAPRCRRDGAPAHDTVRENVHNAPLDPKPIFSPCRTGRDSAPNRSIVVIQFRNSAEASEFAEAYNGRQFNSMEVCPD